MQIKPLLNVKEAIAMYKHLLKPNPSFGTDVYAEDFSSEGIVLIEDESVKSKGKPIRFDCYALILRLDGRSKRSVSQYDYIIKPRSLQLINPGVLFSFEDISSRAKSFVLLFDSDFLIENNLSISLTNEIVDFHTKYDENIELNLNLYAQVLNIFEQINFEFKVKNSGYIKLIKMYLNQLLYLLQREKEKLHTKRSCRKSQQLCSDYLSLIEEHFKSKKKVYEYAELLAITPNYLSEVIQENLNASALSFIHKRILQESEYLLSSTDKAVKQIALELNFDSSSQFGRFFKHNSGVTPKEYRNKVIL